MAMDLHIVASKRDFRSELSTSLIFEVLEMEITDRAKREDVPRILCDWYISGSRRERSPFMRAKVNKHSVSDLNRGLELNCV
jgi:hypothetical protein